MFGIVPFSVARCSNLQAKMFRLWQLLMAVAPLAYCALSSLCTQMNNYKAALTWIDNMNNCESWSSNSHHSFLFWIPSFSMFIIFKNHDSSNIKPPHPFWYCSNLTSCHFNRSFFIVRRRARGWCLRRWRFQQFKSSIRIRELRCIYSLHGRRRRCRRRTLLSCS